MRMQIPTGQHASKPANRLEVFVFDLQVRPWLTKHNFNQLWQAHPLKWNICQRTILAKWFCLCVASSGILTYHKKQPHSCMRTTTHVLQWPTLRNLLLALATWTLSIFPFQNGLSVTWCSLSGSRCLSILQIISRRVSKLLCFIVMLTLSLVTFLLHTCQFTILLLGLMPGMTSIWTILHLHLLLPPWLLLQLEYMLLFRLIMQTTLGSQF